MKQHLRFRGSYCPKRIQPIYLLLLVFLLTGVGEKGAFGQDRLSGRVTDSLGNAIERATVHVKSTNTKTATDTRGFFEIAGASDAVLIVTALGFQRQEVPVMGQGSAAIILQPSDNALDEVQVIGYGQVSRRFNTGSVVTVMSEEIERQPVSNPLAALAGRVAGMTVVQSSGNPGAKVNIQIRGQNSISQGSQPLFIIDGVPFPNDNMGTGAVYMVNQGQSPFDNINPGDIQQIDVLKDADATAIYGSRGANGVVLITTKKGHAGTARLDASIYRGAGRVARRLDLLNTEQYVMMRKEAFANDGISPTAASAPDIMLWDTTRHTDWQDEFIGGTADFTNANVSLAGGNTNTSFLVSGNYNRQTTVYPGEFAQNRGGGLVNVGHHSTDRRFKAMASVNYSRNSNTLPGDLTSYINLPPNTPHLFDDAGKLVWSENGGAFSNPFSALFRRSTAETGNLIGNLSLHYEVIAGLRAGLSAGLNQVQVNDSYFNPTAAQDPNGTNIESTSKFASATNGSWIMEPQLAYDRVIRRSKFNAMVGGTIQNSRNRFYTIEASGFPNDALLEATNFADAVTTATSVTEYRYMAAFGRLNYNYDGRYLVNLTARRDGSSRFGPDKRVADFGAIGAAWVFSEERWLKQHAAWLSFGKLRGSYGITGNDQIGDYQYLDNYRATSRDYQGVLGYIPSRLFNADYSWERNRKLEAGLETGFLDNRLRLNASWFRNRSDNQLINYKLPDQTGFPSILRNFGALVQNSGLEVEVYATLIQSQSWKWTMAGNVTRNRNELLAFEGLESSSYANQLVIGYPLGIRKYLHWTGVDPETGIHTFEGTSRPADQTVIADFTPRYYGGMQQSVSWRGWSLDVHFQFSHRNGGNYLTNFGTFAPGRNYNQPVEVLGRWKGSGDRTSIQRFTTAGAASTAYGNYAGYSDVNIADASFTRIRNLYLSYSPLLHRHGHAQGRSLTLYIQLQNAFTWTDYEGLDPETGSISLPSLAIFALGFKFSI